MDLMNDAFLAARKLGADIASRFGLTAVSTHVHEHHGSVRVICSGGIEVYTDGNRWQIKRLSDGKTIKAATLSALASAVNGAKG